MSLSSVDLTHLIAATVVLLVAAHLLGRLAVKLRQPRVAGEILGGLLLGPTLLGLVAPGWYQAIFKTGTVTEAGLGIAYQLGLLLLMYCSGAELRALLSRSERKPVLGIAVIGNVVPFLAALGFLALYDTGRFLGPAGDRISFGLAFALAIAVTSIPVISRIMADLGILHTRFARVVLSVAVLEDLVIYVVLNLALARVAAANAEASGLLGVLGVEPSGPLGTGYYIVVTLAFFLVPVVTGPGLVQRLADWRGNVLHRASPIAFQMVVMLALAGLAAFLGVAPIFGALVAGILAGDLRGPDLEARQAITSISTGVVVPLYFAIVGLRLDLANSFEPLFFLVLLAFACLVKSASCYAGARMVGESRWGARNLAVALNARGGPGIVLASVTLDAGIINDRFYTMLVLLALITSVIAGTWLEAVLRRGRDLLTEEPTDAEHRSGMRA
ncbi:MAG TPA: cation:proton antiporter [Actinomycetota bacterium]|nr:cation:proton antiporter [Actinomycetota bacterium]